MQAVRAAARRRLLRLEPLRTDAGAETGVQARNATLPAAPRLQRRRPMQSPGVRHP